MFGSELRKKRASGCSREHSSGDSPFCNGRRQGKDVRDIPQDRWRRNEHNWRYMHAVEEGWKAHVGAGHIFCGKRRERRSCYCLWHKHGYHDPAGGKGKIWKIHPFAPCGQSICDMDMQTQSHKKYMRRFPRCQGFRHG